MQTNLFSPDPIKSTDLAGKKVTVMGLGLFGGGRGLAEFLSRAGAELVVTDLRKADTLRPSLQALEGLPIRWVLGEHREQDFFDADMVFVNPAVPRDLPLLQNCQQRGIHLETEMNLFFKLCKGRICGITGSNGKTTTTSLTGQIFKEASSRARIGGNIGISLLGHVHEIEARDWVVLELSSFQLEDLSPLERRPDISLVTNLSPNHLNRHLTYENYLNAKKIILEGDGWAILNGDDTRVRAWAASTRRRVIYYGRAGTVRPRAPGVWLIGNEVVSADGTSLDRLFHQDDLQLPGTFNLINAAGAAAAALAAGHEPRHILDGVRSFRPIEHRLEFVTSYRGVEYYNDSISTTPESAICAIDALGPDVILIAGGSDKGSSFSLLGRKIASRTKGAVLIGKTAPKIMAAIDAGDRRAEKGVRILRATSLEGAIDAAGELANSGDRVVLSPACASYDMFTHFAERGQLFKDIVNGLADRQ